MRVANNDARYQISNGALQTAARTGNRWMLSMNWRLPDSEYRTLRGEIAQLQGVRHRASVPMSILGYQRGGVGGGTPLVNGAHTAGATSLSVKGMPNSTTGVLVPGDFLQVGNQLTQVVSTLTSNGSGVGSCNIWPELHQNYANDTAIVYTTACAGLFIMVSDLEVGSSSFAGSWFGEMTAEFMQDVLA